MTFQGRGFESRTIHQGVLVGRYEVKACEGDQGVIKALESHSDNCGGGGMAAGRR
jgi:hypothetical protein